MTIRHSFLRGVIGPCYFADNGDDGAGVGTGGAGGGNGDGGADNGSDMYNVNGGNNGSEGAGNDNGSNLNFEEFKSTYAKDYLEKPYMQAIDSPEKLFKEFDNAQNLIGKKISIPGPDATDKEQDEYLDLIRPKDKSIYKLSDSHLPENLKGFHMGDFENKITDLFQQAALTPKQASILQEGYDKLMLDINGQALAQYAEIQKANAINDADFNALADKTWGAERETVQSTAKALLQQFTPQEFKGGLDKLSNENLVIMASVLKGISDKYISQDDLNALRGSGSTTQSLDSLKTTAQEKMAQLMSMDVMDPKYSTLQKEVNELYAQIGKLSGDK